jgi:phosphoglycolate phosphatase
VDAIPVSALILFDIDGTLILSGRAGLRGMNAAFAELYGRDHALDGISFAGRTDRAIVLDVFRPWKPEAADADVFALREIYCQRLVEEIRKPVKDPSCILPGVARMLESLASRPDVGVGLLTGNFERSAAIKLGHFGLGPEFRFGAFGDHHVDRRRLVPIALDAARAAGYALPPASRVVVIGDTPLDVDCAHANGVSVVGVATGGYDRAALETAGAHLTLETLEDLDAFDRWLASLG